MPTLRELECPKDCPGRSVTCHSTCERHAEYRAEAERLRQLRHEESMTFHYQLSKRLNAKENRFR